MPVGGSTIAGDWMDVVPLSTSFAPAQGPAVSPVIRQFDVPSAQASTWRATRPRWVGMGSPRSHRPRVTVSVPSGLTTQPRSLSKSSAKTMVGGAGWNVAVNVVSATGVEISCVAAPPSDHEANVYTVPPEVWGETTP